MPGAPQVEDGTADDKFYHCTICGKGFYDAPGVRRHQKAEHENITHSCVCGKVYKYRSGLTQHQKICHVPKPST